MIVEIARCSKEFGSLSEGKILVVNEVPSELGDECGYQVDGVQCSEDDDETHRSEGESGPVAFEATTSGKVIRVILNDRRRAYN